MGLIGYRALSLLALGVLLQISVPAGFAEDISIGNGSFKLSQRGLTSGIQSGVSDELTTSVQPIAACLLETPGGYIYPKSATYRTPNLSFEFTDESSITLQVTPGDGFTIFRLASLDNRSSATGLQLFRLPVRSGAKINRTLNTAYYDGNAVGIMAATPEILPSAIYAQVRTADLPGCMHKLTPSSNAKEGTTAADFTATCTLPTPGWSMAGRNLTKKMPLDSIVGLSAWIHGDGSGQQLKFQLTDEGGGARDYYVPIDFTGWRHVNMVNPALDLRKGQSLAGLNLYYNGIPANTSVTCLVDDIQALGKSDSTTTTRLLEGFEETESPWWSDSHQVLSLIWDFKYAGVGDAFGVISCPEDSFFEVVQRFEEAAGIITPHPGGQWNKQSQAIKESYLFLTSFSEKQFDKALAIAKRGGFKQVLLGQESWCKSTGHYEIKDTNFAGGVAGLKDVVDRFRSNGIDVGLHLLGASIDNNDPYLTPVPDPRLVNDAHTTLTSALDPDTTTIAVAEMPEGFPAEDGGYNGDGTVLQIGSELIRYDSRTTASPYIFTGCVRGHLGTNATTHQPGEAVHHLARSYGYHMFNMDTSLLGEVTSNFAAVANACDIGMVYFDGSERLQGSHDRYNSRLINAYLSKLARKDILVQASSFSHFSWHQLARTASADGHGDLKGYLEERAPSFNSFKQIGIPLDIGWYYGYDTSATLDMYEYILGTTIGYDSSFSYQVSVAAADNHPFTGEILDLIKRYEDLRLQDRVPEQMKQFFQVPKELQGKAPEDPSRDNSLRRDYRLLRQDGEDVFQRVVYGEWQHAAAGSSETEWNLNITTGPATVGFQVQALNSQTTAVLMNPVFQVSNDPLTWFGELGQGQYLTLWPGEPSALNGAPLKEALRGSSSTSVITLDPGTYTVKVALEKGAALPYRVRIMLNLPEKHPVPAK